MAAIGVGAEIVAIDSYLAELMLKAMRGRGFAISKSIQYCAVPVAGVLSVLLGHRSFMDVQGWRWMLVLPAVGAVLIWWVRRGLPESPRWLATNGRGVEADLIMSSIEARIEARLNRRLPPAVDQMAVLDDRRYGDLLRPPLSRRMVTMIIASCAISISFFGFNNWLPSLLEARGVELTKSLLYASLVALSFPIAPYLFSFFADRIERKFQIMIGSVVVVGSGLMFSAQSTFIGWTVFGVLVVMGNNLSSYGVHTYRAEQFPTGLRARAVGIIYSADRLATAFSSFLIGFILIEGGVTGVLAFTTAMAVLGMVTVGIFGPRTLDMSPDAAP